MNYILFEEAFSHKDFPEFDRQTLCFSLPCALSLSALLAISRLENMNFIRKEIINNFIDVINIVRSLENSNKNYLDNIMSLLNQIAQTYIRSQAWNIIINQIQSNCRHLAVYLDEIFMTYIKRTTKVNEVDNGTILRIITQKLDVYCIYGNKIYPENKQGPGYIFVIARNKDKFSILHHKEEKIIEANLDEDKKMCAFPFYCNPFAPGGIIFTPSYYRNTIEVIDKNKIVVQKHNESAPSSKSINQYYFTVKNQVEEQKINTQINNPIQSVQPCKNIFPSEINQNQAITKIPQPFNKLLPNFISQQISEISPLSSNIFNSQVMVSNPVAQKKNSKKSEIPHIKSLNLKTELNLSMHLVFKPFENCENPSDSEYSYNQSSNKILSKISKCSEKNYCQFPFQKIKQSNPLVEPIKIKSLFKKIYNSHQISEEYKEKAVNYSSNKYFKPDYEKGSIENYSISSLTQKTSEKISSESFFAESSSQSFLSHKEECSKHREKYQSFKTNCCRNHCLNCLFEIIKSNIGDVKKCPCNIAISIKDQHEINEKMKGLNTSENKIEKSIRCDNCKRFWSSDALHMCMCERKFIICSSCKVKNSIDFCPNCGDPIKT